MATAVDVSKMDEQSIVPSSSIGSGSLKTTEFMDLPFELMSIILGFLAMSDDGGRALVWASATCKILLAIARQPDIMKVVNCDMHMLLCDYNQHRRIDGLLCRCVRAGNDTADNILAVVMLWGGQRLWTEIQEKSICLRTIRHTPELSLSFKRLIARSLVTGSITDLPFIQFCLEDTHHVSQSYRRLRPLRLIIYFIARLSPNQMFTFCFWLRDCILTIWAYHMLFESSILDILGKICHYARFASEEEQVRMHPKFRNLLLEAFIRFIKLGSGNEVMSNLDLISEAEKFIN